MKLYKTARHQERCEVLLKILQPELKICEICNKEIPVDELQDHLFAHEMENSLRQPPSRAPVSRAVSAPRNVNNQIIEIIRDHSQINRNIEFTLAIRFGRRTSIQNRTNPKPNPEAVKQLPVNRCESSASEIMCTICLDNIKKGKRIKTLPCFHQFHVRCIDKWLENSYFCPVCKGNI